MPPLVASRTMLRHLPLPSTVLRLELGWCHRHEGAVLTAHSSFQLSRALVSLSLGRLRPRHSPLLRQRPGERGVRHASLTVTSHWQIQLATASGTSRKAPRAHPSLRDKSHPSRPPRLGAHKAVNRYASPPDSAISNVAAEESARTQRNPSRCYGLRHVRR